MIKYCEKGGGVFCCRKTKVESREEGLAQPYLCAWIAIIPTAFLQHFTLRIILLLSLSFSYSLSPFFQPAYSFSLSHKWPDCNNAPCNLCLSSGCLFFSNSVFSLSIYLSPLSSASLIYWHISKIFVVDKKNLQI